MGGPGSGRRLDSLTHKADKEARKRQKTRQAGRADAEADDLARSLARALVDPRVDEVARQRDRSNRCAAVGADDVWEAVRLEQRLEWLADGLWLAPDASSTLPLLTRAVARPRRDFAPSPPPDTLLSGLPPLPAWPQIFWQHAAAGSAEPRSRWKLNPLLAEAGATSASLHPALSVSAPR